MSARPRAQVYGPISTKLGFKRLRPSFRLKFAYELRSFYSVNTGLCMWKGFVSCFSIDLFKLNLKRSGVWSPIFTGLLESVLIRLHGLTYIWFQITFSYIYYVTIFFALLPYPIFSYMPNLSIHFVTFVLMYLHIFIFISYTFHFPLFPLLLTCFSFLFYFLLILFPALYSFLSVFILSVIISSFVLISSVSLYFPSSEFWHRMASSEYQHLGGTYCLHLQGARFLPDYTVL
jgi:hypothetical protein